MLDLAEVAERLNCCQKTVRTKIATGELAAYKLSKRMWRVSEDDLEGYLRIFRSTERSTPRSTHASKTLRHFPPISKAGKSA